jgi:type I restriction enzyme S subunit
MSNNCQKYIPLGDVFKVSSGGTPSRKKNEYFYGDIPWVKTGDLKGVYAKKPKEFITKLGLDSSSAKLFPPNTVLLAMYGATIGACSILSFEAATNQACAAILPNENYDEKYLYYYFAYIKPSLIRQGVGGAQPNISSGLIKKLKIPDLELKEQKKIAEILDAADSLRQKDQQLVEHYDRLSRSLFLDMFGDPVRNNKKLTMIKLGVLGKWQSGGTPSRKIPSYYEGDIPWLASGELNQIYTSDSKEHITKQAVNDSNTKLIDKGSILLGMYDTAALKSTINTKIVTCNQAIAYCKLNEKLVNTSFVYHIIQIGKEHYRRLQRGVRQKNLNLSMVKNIEVLYPDLKLQNDFADRVYEINEQKELAQQNLKKSDDLFNCLLQKAFKGRLTDSKLPD